MHADEEALDGGNATADVVRVGDTVRKPWSPSSPSVDAFSLRLLAAGVDVPRPLGRDDRGRRTIEFAPGLTLRRPLTDQELARVGAIVRRIHDASAGMPLDGTWDVLLPPPTPADLICHNDLAPWNLVVGDRWTFIDADGAGPSTRAWDLAYAMQAFTTGDPHVDPATTARRIAAFAGGYGADDALRAALPTLLGDRADAMRSHLEAAHRSGTEPWGTMWSSGHGEHWSAVTAYLRSGERHWRAALS